jgi:hypothetical protein
VTDDGPDKEAVVCDLCAHLHTGSAQVKVHLVVGTGNGGQGKVTHAVQLQLEGQRWLQVTVDPVLLKLETHGDSPLHSKAVAQDTVTDSRTQQDTVTPTNEGSRHGNDLSSRLRNDNQLRLFYHPQY